MGEKDGSSLRFELWDDDCGECVRASRSGRERLERYSGRLAGEISEERESSSLDESERSGMLRVLRMGAMMAEEDGEARLETAEFVVVKSWWGQCSSLNVLPSHPSDTMHWEDAAGTLVTERLELENDFRQERYFAGGLGCLRFEPRARQRFCSPESCGRKEVAGKATSGWDLGPSPGQLCLPSIDNKAR